MRDFRGVSVAVVDQDGRPLEEWGEQKVGNIASCYIRSEKDKRFQITITPNMQRWGRLFSQNDLYEDHHLLATLRLDGREALERRVIIYLDRKHKYFDRQADGAVTMTGKKIQDESGNTRLYTWIFQEVGIELLLENLSITEQTTVDEKHHEADPLIAAFADLGSNKLADKEEKSSLGLIELTLDRVHVEHTARPRTTLSLRAEFHDGSDAQVGKDTKHVAVTSTGGEIITSSQEEIEYWKLHRDEGEYAKYKFFYRSEDVLRKFGFAGSPPAGGVRGAAQAADKVVASPPRKEKRKKEEVDVVDADEDEWYVSKSRSRTTRTTLPILLKK